MSSTQEIFIIGQISGQNEINIIKAWLIVARTLIACTDKFSIHPSVSLTNFKNLQSISVIFSKTLLGSSRRIVKLCTCLLLMFNNNIELHCTNHQKHCFTISRNFKGKNHMKYNIMYWIVWQGFKFYRLQLICSCLLLSLALPFPSLFLYFLVNPSPVLLTFLRWVTSTNVRTKTLLGY